MARPNTPSAPTPPSTLIWDLPTRVFHWSLLGVVVTAAASGFWEGPGRLAIHMWAGYAMVGLLVFRLIWGLVGGRYSRFSGFLLSPKDLMAHGRGLMAKKSDLHAGHNPAGSWMVIALIIVLTLVAISGLVTLGGRELLGPLAAWVDFKTGDGARELHEGAVWALIALVALHVGGVIMEQHVFRHPVVQSMINGRKPVAVQQSEISGLLIGRGLIVAAIVIAGLAAAGTTLASKPSDRWHALSQPDEYVNACKECHHAHHPSLRTATDWQVIMAGLDQHFGENASIAPALATNITAFLQANDANHFDTLAANKIGRATSPGGRISETRFWKRKHDEIDPKLFKSRNVGSAANCSACHQDAASGRFADAAIDVPEGDK